MGWGLQGRNAQIHDILELAKETVKIQIHGLPATGPEPDLVDLKGCLESLCL